MPKATGKGDDHAADIAALEKRVGTLETYAAALAKWTTGVKAWATIVNAQLKLQANAGGGDSPPTPPEWPPK